MQNDYVLNHDYGYGKHPEQRVLNKLSLRNIEDLKTYIIQLVEDMFYATFEDWYVIFKEDNLITKIIIENIKN